MKKISLAFFVFMIAFLLAGTVSAQNQQAGLTPPDLEWGQPYYEVARTMFRDATPENIKKTVISGERAMFYQYYKNEDFRSIKIVISQYVPTAESYANYAKKVQPLLEKYSDLYNSAATREEKTQIVSEYNREKMALYYLLELKKEHYATLIIVDEDKQGNFETMYSTRNGTDWISRPVPADHPDANYEWFMNTDNL